MIGKSDRFLDQSIDIDRTVLSRALSGMEQHVLDDRVGALAVLHDLVQIALQRIGYLPISARSLLSRCTLPSASCNSSMSSTETAEKLLTKLSGFLISWAI